MAFVDQRYGASFPRLFAQPTAKLRQDLFLLNGVGAETADSILLETRQHPWLESTLTLVECSASHGPNTSYEETRQLCEHSHNRFCSNFRSQATTFALQKAPAHRRLA